MMLAFRFLESAFYQIQLNNINAHFRTTAYLGFFGLSYNVCAFNAVT